MIKGNRSRGTTMGMKRWYMSIPRCSHPECKIKLVQGKYRETKLCAKHQGYEKTNRPT